MKTNKYFFHPLPTDKYIILNRESGKALDVHHPHIDINSANVQQWDYYGTPNQQWELKKIEVPVEPKPTIPVEPEPTKYIGNKNTKEIHRKGCSWEKRMADHNKEDIEESELNDYLGRDYDGCYYCFREKHWK